MTTGEELMTRARGNWLNSVVYMQNVLIKLEPLLWNTFIFLNQKGCFFHTLSTLFFNRLLFDAQMSLCLSVCLSLIIADQSIRETIRAAQVLDGGCLRIESPPTWGSAASGGSWHEWGHLTSQSDSVYCAQKSAHPITCIKMTIQWSHTLPKCPITAPNESNYSI